MDKAPWYERSYVKAVFFFFSFASAFLFVLLLYLIFLRDLPQNARQMEPCMPEAGCTLTLGGNMYCFAQTNEPPKEHGGLLVCDAEQGEPLRWKTGCAAGYYCGPNALEDGCTDTEGNELYCSSEHRQLALEKPIPTISKENP